ncbi:hypothetical protein KIL84_020365 [Mauremys mutica]|uniref:G/T mismatch-specific thymine DNA glycosylase n=1 Tax=Mauremys mutica TaxID=74926 RepID=A0A9D3XWL2_9SAUR|nr:hypothetical protein KIL84_020365 [Mauremys mutica]
MGDRPIEPLLQGPLPHWLGREDAAVIREAPSLVPCLAPYYSPLQQAQAFYTFPFHQMMTAAPNMEIMNEQQIVEGISDTNFAQEPIQEVTKGRKRKTKSTEPKKPAAKAAKSTKSKGKQEKITDTFKVKRKVDRFNGVSEAELLTKTLPDILTFNLDIVIIGINPGLMAAYKGHHYPGPGNHFCKFIVLFFLLRFAEFCHNMTNLNEAVCIFNFLNTLSIVCNLTTSTYYVLSCKATQIKQKWVINDSSGLFYKCIYDIFSKEVFGVKVKKLEFGLQPHKVPDTETLCYVMPSSSARCAQFPRAQDKVHYYIKLKDLRDQLKGITSNTEVQEVQYTFDLQLAQEDAKKMAVKEEKYDPGYEAAYGGAYSEKTPYEHEQCNFASNGTEANNLGYSGGSSFGDIPNGQWMMQSFTDQIPEFSNSGAQEQEESSV